MRYSLEPCPDCFVLQELLPAAALREGMDGCLAIRQALATGELKGRSARELDAWATGERRALLTAATRFLRGARLEEAEEVFARDYRAQLQKSKEAQGPLAWLSLDDSFDLVAPPYVERVVRETSLCFASSFSMSQP